MASSKQKAFDRNQDSGVNCLPAKIPKPQPEGESNGGEAEIPLPQTLVRIPVQDAQPSQSHSTAT